jgi:hypothetical protein
VAAILLVIVVGVRLALNPIAAHFTQKGLDSLEGYQGTFDKVSVGLFPPSYKITDLKLTQQGTKPEEPLAYVKTLKASLIGRKLLKGQLVAVATADHAKFIVKFGVTEPPKPKTTKKDEGDKEQTEDPFNLQAALNKVIPLRADRIELRDSELVLIDATEARRPRFWVNDIEMVIDNLVTRKNLDRNAPQVLTLRAMVERTGILKVLATANVIEDKRPAVNGQAQLTGLMLESLHAWSAAKAGVSAKGTFDAFANFSSADGKVSGAVKVMVKEPDLKPATEKAGDAVKAAIGRMALKVLSDRVEGREAVATTLPIKGSLTEPGPQVWPAVLNLVRNAFVQGLDWGFSDLPPETAKKKQDPLTQTKEGLDKKEEGAKAQPR